MDLDGGGGNMFGLCRVLQNELFLVLGRVVYTRAPQTQLCTSILQNLVERQRLFLQIRDGARESTFPLSSQVGPVFGQAGLHFER